MQIVDNLQCAPFNDKMLKSDQDASAAAARPPVPGAVEGTIAVLKSNSLPSLVQRELERMILAGDLPAGAKITEADIAMQLGVSRGPVREAFRALEASGLVRLEKNRGVFVRQISVAEADDIFELRALLEEFAGRRVAATATPVAISELRRCVEKMDDAALDKDVDRYFQANVAFHDRLVELAGNAKLLFTYRRLVNELNLYRRAALSQDGTLPLSAREHHDILDRIAAGDAAAAGHALLQHALGSRERMHRHQQTQTARAAALPPRTRRKA